MFISLKDEGSICINLHCSHFIIAFQVIHFQACSEFILEGHVCPQVFGVRREYFFNCNNEFILGGMCSQGCSTSFGVQLYPKRTHLLVRRVYVSERKTGKRWRGLSTWQAVWLYLIQDSERIHRPLIRSVCASWQKASKKVMWFCHVVSGAHNNPCACTYTCK